MIRDWSLKTNYVIKYQNEREMYKKQHDYLWLWMEVCVQKPIM